MPEITIGLMTPSDAKRVALIEKDTFSTPWTEEALLKEISENRCARYIVLREDGDVAAYAGMWLVIDEGHIINVAVRKDRRSIGYGERVMRSLMQLAADSGVVYMTLEVRRSNTPARRLYEKLGFREMGVRKGYYNDNREDAVIYVTDSMPEACPENDPFLITE